MVSPFLPAACRFTPTCSCYALTCFSTHSFGTAAKLSVMRLWRCRPGYPGGYDPVPTAPVHHHSHGIPSRKGI